MVRWLSIAVFGIVIAAVDGIAGDDKKGVDKLEGAWIATSWQRGDGKIGKDEVNTLLTITKNEYAFPKGINRISAKGTFKADTTKGTIDFMPEDGPAKGKTLLGIYKVEGDKLTLCFTSAGNARPKEFKSGERNIVLATYERKK
jgi:uncharacterized protein (TIGR03067 family)